MSKSGICEATKHLNIYLIFLKQVCNNHQLLLRHQEDEFIIKIKHAFMSNNMQNFVSGKDRAKINLYIEVSLVAFFLAIIAFSALVLFE
jgi:hypothetical protein